MNPDDVLRQLRIERDALRFLYRRREECAAMLARLTKRIKAQEEKVKTLAELPAKLHAINIEVP